MLPGVLMITPKIYSDNREVPDKLRQVSIDSLKVAGSLGQFNVGVRELDLMMLPALSSAPNRSWTDALAGMNVLSEFVVKPSNAGYVVGHRVLHRRAQPSAKRRFGLERCARFRMSAGR